VAKITSASPPESIFDSELLKSRVGCNLPAKLKERQMRKLLFPLVVFGICISVSAQDFPRAEIFGGYSYGNFQILSNRSGLNGWNASATVNIYRWFGLTTDVGGLYGGKGSQVITLPTPIGTETESLKEHFHTFLFGPQFAYRSGRISGFAHLLIGETRANESLTVTCPTCFILVSPFNSNTVTQTALALGVGADYKLTRTLAWRVQADYLPISSSNNMRVSTGLVFRVGK
jgi:opacity protein-like surface antigen